MQHQKNSWVLKQHSQWTIKIMMKRHYKYCWEEKKWVEQFKCRGPSVISLNKYEFGWKDPRAMTREELFKEYYGFIFYA